MNERSGNERGSDVVVGETRERDDTRPSVVLALSASLDSRGLRAACALTHCGGGRFPPHLRSETRFTGARGERRHARRDVPVDAVHLHGPTRRPVSGRLGSRPRRRHLPSGHRGRHLRRVRVNPHTRDRRTVVCRLRSIERFDATERPARSLFRRALKKGTDFPLLSLSPTCVCVCVCRFERLDGNAVIVSGYNRDATVRDSDFAFIGGNAVIAWGERDRAREIFPPRGGVPLICISRYLRVECVRDSLLPRALGGFLFGFFSSRIYIYIPGELVARATLHIACISLRPARRVYERDRVRPRPARGRARRLAQGGRERHRRRAPSRHARDRVLGARDRLVREAELLLRAGQDRAVRDPGQRIREPEQENTNNCVALVTVHRRSCAFPQVFFNGPRAGINANDGFGGGDDISRNLVFSTCRESGDHGPFNSWDRRPTTVEICNSVGVRDWLRRCRTRTTESVLESHGPCESFELSKVRIGLETTEL